MHKTLLPLTLVSLALLTACSSLPADVTAPAENGEPAPSAFEATDNIGDIAATVNGEEITGQEYKQALVLARKNALMQNRDPFDPTVNDEIREETLDQLIQNKAVIYKAKNSDIIIEESEVDAEVEKIITQVGGEENLKEELAKTDSTMEKLRKNILEQKTAQKYVDDYVEELEIELSDEELKERFDSVTEGKPNPPKFEDVKEQVRTQMLQEKKQEAIKELLEKLAEEATVKKM